MSASGQEFKVDDALPGTKYRIVKTLGAGGMGVVYQVVKPPNIQGVLKLMSSELTRHEEHRMRFFDEVRILAQLDHPNIVRVFDYDALEDGTPYYVMELLTGRTVRDVIHTIGRVPPRVAYEITRQLLEALQAAHTHEVPVIHRDVKPENIFLHAPRHGEPVVKLIDFGVSSVADRKHDGAFVGTWSYAAPEQIRGQVPTPATDLYAAGLVLYEMLAGVGPFDHYQDWGEVAEAQLNQVPDPVSKRAPWVPESIVSLIQSALAKDPRMRPRDAYAFAERLFELEWASDGKDPHDLTVEGPTSSRLRAKAENAAKPTLDANQSGPLSQVLHRITHAQGSSEHIPVAAPISEKPADVPQVAIRAGTPAARGMTWQGVGGKDFTSPDTDALLAGLGLPTGAKPVSKKERESNPELGVGAKKESGEHDAVTLPKQKPESPRTPRVIVRDAAAREEVSIGATTEAAPDRESGRALADLRDSSRDVAPTRDTFSSQQSDPGSPPPRSRTAPLFLAAAVIAIGVAFAAVIMARDDAKSGAAAAPAVTAVAPKPIVAAPAPSPVVSAATSATSASEVATAMATPLTSASAVTPAPAVPKAKKAAGKKAPADAPSAARAGAAPTATGSGEFIRTF
jgi:serine/threonine-protein kinase